jgi:4-hydroxy-tetrahydrodipicolinate synthase
LCYKPGFIPTQGFTDTMREQLTAENLKGNWATLLLPVNADDTFNYQKLEAEVAMLIAAGVDGIYSNGTAGEFHNQTEAEFDEVNAMLSRLCLQAGMRFQIGASHPSPVISLERLKRSLALKPDAIQVILPDWVTVTNGEMIDYLKKLADEAQGIPLVLYNPPHAKRVLQPKDYELTKQIPQVIGVKLLSRDEAWVDEMKVRCRAFIHFCARAFFSQRGG